VELSFDGASNEDNFAVAGFRILPPDTNGDVGPNHYVQWVNLVARIFDKEGNTVLGPFAGNQFFVGLGGRCETQNDGDPIVLYDHLADRWVVMQFMIGARPYALCIAVSQTPDPTLGYYQYEFPFEYFPDYPKLGVWPDAYYATTRSFYRPYPGFAQEAVAFEREKMLQGLPAQMVLFLIPDPGFHIDGFLPADLDGPAPPAGTPGLFAGIPFWGGPNEIRLYGLDVDWARPEASTFSPLGTLPTAPFDNSITNVPQPGTTRRLDAIPHFLMHRLQYRNFGGHQTLLANHTVDVGGDRAGIRWYELREGGGGWGIYQQGTYAPDDGLHRWMGSMAMNGAGDIALGYSVSSSTTFPSIRFTGQSADQSGTGLMNVAEVEIHAGSGSQTHSSERWGDYSMMAVDPSDDESFWYTTEYYKTTSVLGWSTRIAAFTIDSPTIDSPPVIAVAEKPLVLWPPTGGYHTVRVRDFVVRVSDDATDLSLDDVYITRVSSDEAENGEDDGNTLNDITLDGCRSFAVRAERSGVGDGRVYTVEVAAEDAAGNVGTASFEVWVPIRRNRSAVNSGAVYTVESACQSEAALIAGAAPEGTPGTAGERPETAAAARSGAAVPTEVTLGQNYPNPFRGSTVVEFGLAEGGVATLKVFDVVGREVAVLSEGYLDAGYHRAAFDAERLSPGLYVLELRAGGARHVLRMTLVR
jgi:hypothetical protein